MGVCAETVVESIRVISPNKKLYFLFAIMLELCCCIFCGIGLSFELCKVIITGNGTKVFNEAGISKFSETNLYPFMLLHVIKRLCQQNNVPNFHKFVAYS